MVVRYHRWAPIHHEAGRKKWEDEECGDVWGGGGGEGESLIHDDLRHFITHIHRRWISCIVLKSV